MDAPSYREDLQKMLVIHAQESFKEKMRVSSLIEDKAQKTAALAGVFLAAGFSYIKKENLDANSPFGSSITLLLLSCAIVGLIISVLLCLWVLLIRNQAAPIGMPVMEALISQNCSVPDDQLSQERQSTFRKQVANIWAGIVQVQDTLNAQKASGVRRAQSCLAVCIVLVAVSLLSVLLNSLVIRVISVFKG